jgi:hypothetical protein
MKWKTKRCHYFNFIHILTHLYIFRAYRPIFRRVHTAVHTTIVSVSVPFRPRALYVVAGLGDCSLLELLWFFISCWKDARYKKLKKKDAFSLSNHIYILNVFNGFDTFLNKRQHIYLQAQLVDEKPILAVFTFFQFTCLLAECLSIVSHISSVDRNVKYCGEFLWQIWSNIYLLYNVRL